MWLTEVKRNALWCIRTRNFSTVIKIPSVYMPPELLPDCWQKADKSGMFLRIILTDLNYWIKHPFEFSDPILKPEYL